jgi:hypothetical protein
MRHCDHPSVSGGKSMDYDSFLFSARIIQSRYWIICEYVTVDDTSAGPREVCNCWRSLESPILQRTLPEIRPRQPIGEPPPTNLAT